MVVARSFCWVFMARVFQVLARALWVVAMCLEPRVSAGGQFSGGIISLFTSTHTHKRSSSRRDLPIDFLAKEKTKTQREKKKGSVPESTKAEMKPHK